MNRLQTNAGYDILRVSEAYGSDGNGATYHIVLGISPQGHYVTWDATRRRDGSWDYFYGHYVQDKLAAYQDYHRRLMDKFDGGRETETTAQIVVTAAPHNYTPASLMHLYAKEHHDKACAVNLPHGGTALHLYDLGRSYVYDHWDIADGGEDGHTVTLHLAER